MRWSHPEESKATHMIPLAGSNNPGAARAPAVAGIASMRRRGARGGRRRARGAAPPALVAALVAAASVGRASAQECTTVNLYDQGNDSPDHLDTCAELLDEGSGLGLTCAVDFVSGGQYAGM